MTAIDTAFALIIVGLLGCIGFFVALGARAMYVEAHPNETAQCTPSRRANITASQPQALPRRIAMQLAPAISTADYAVARPIDVDAIRANSRSYDLAALTAPAVPELPPVVVLVVEEEEEQQGIPVDWPTRIVQPVPLRGEALL